MPYAIATSEPKSPRSLHGWLVWKQVRSSFCFGSIGTDGSAAFRERLARKIKSKMAFDFSTSIGCLNHGQNSSSKTVAGDQTSSLHFGSGMVQSQPMLIGTLVNVAGILVGGIVGLVKRKPLSLAQE